MHLVARLPVPDPLRSFVIGGTAAVAWAIPVLVRFFAHEAVSRDMWVFTLIGCVVLAAAIQKATVHRTLEQEWILERLPRHGQGYALLLGALLLGVWLD